MPLRSRAFAAVLKIADGFPVLISVGYQRPVSVDPRDRVSSICLPTPAHTHVRETERR